MKWLEDYKRFVTREGRVFRYSQDGKRIVECKYQKPKNGYLTLHINKKTVLVHRLVALAFIPNPNEFPCVDHINRDRCDNRVENLRWVTNKENNMNTCRNLEVTREYLKDHSEREDKNAYQRIYMKEYREKNRERFREYNRKSYWKHKVA